MEIKNYFATDAEGNILPQANVYIYEAGTTTLVSGLKNLSGASIPNPFTAMQNGLVQFRAPDNNYDMRVSKLGREYTLRIQCFDGIAFSYDLYESGVSRFQYDGETLEQALNKARALDGYADLRSYGGSATIIHITDYGVSGFFKRSGSVPATDNGVTRIVDGLGRTWDRMYSGPANVLWAGVVAGEPDSTPGIQAAIDACRDIFIPNGTYNIDCHKGSQTTYNNSRRGGLWVYDGVKITGQSREGTILKNISDNSTSGISIRGGNGIELKEFTLDLDWPNKSCAIPSFSSSRGEGILFWNAISPANNFLAENLRIKRTGHYGIGIQNCEARNYRITGCIFEDIGGDPIDVKDYSAYPKQGFINNVETGRFGLNATALNGAENPAGFDLRGDVLATDLRVTDLNIWIPDGSGAPYTCGVRINANVDSEGRLGGRKARVHGATVKSSKLAGEGSDTLKRIYGFGVSESFGAIVGGVAENCFRGIVVSKGGDSTPIGTSILAFTAINCKGSGADGTGVYIGNGCSNTTVQATSINCDVGFYCDSQANDVSISCVGNTLDHNMKEDVIRQGNYNFISKDAIKSSLQGNSPNNLKDSLTVWAFNDSVVTLRTTFDGAWASPFRSSSYRFRSGDTSGAGAVDRGGMYHRYTGSTGGSSELDFGINAGEGVIFPFSVRSTGPITPFLGNYPDDASAASAGVPVWGQYRTGSIVKVRQS